MNLIDGCYPLFNTEACGFAAAFIFLLNMGTDYHYSHMNLTI